jgi:hypothetical protein
MSQPASGKEPPPSDQIHSKSQSDREYDRQGISEKEGHGSNEETEYCHGKPETKAGFKANPLESEYPG